MDAKDIVEKIVKDKGFAKNFKSSPAKALEGLLGVNLPDEQVNSILEAVKGKVNLETIGGLLDTDGDGKADLGGLAKLGDMLKK